MIKTTDELLKELNKLTAPKAIDNREINIQREHYKAYKWLQDNYFYLGEALQCLSLTLKPLTAKQHTPITVEELEKCPPHKFGAVKEGKAPQAVRDFMNTRRKLEEIKKMYKSIGDIDQETYEGFKGAAAYCVGYNAALQAVIERLEE